ncbi:hypothetical protein RR42_s2923 [Cupriavidus basilensis]|uniref:Uncharacterized protein n=1 Tax=Cupriavidus basilensis TaxID=68895 RepID=A0A0C4YR86_9BURK|nr:hypothetical protein RR42_s2923 [Cupriavidus basilensis]
MKLPFKPPQHRVAQDQQQYNGRRRHDEILADLSPACPSQTPEVTLDHDFLRRIATHRRRGGIPAPCRQPAGS